MINKAELAAATFDGLVVYELLDLGASSSDLVMAVNGDAVKLAVSGENAFASFTLCYSGFDCGHGYIGATIQLKPVASVATVPADDIQDAMDYEIKSYAVADNALAICFDCDEVHCVAGLAFALTESQKTRLDLLLDEYFQDKFADADLDGKLTMIIPTGVTNDY